MQNRYSFFLNNTDSLNGYYAAKAERNLVSILKDSNYSVVTVINNSDSAGYIEGAFNVTVRDNNIDVKIYHEIDKIKGYMSRALVGLTEWISRFNIDINEIIKEISSAEIDSFERIVFKVIYTLLEKYSNYAAELILSEELGFPDKNKVFEAIEKLCEESDFCLYGDWILEFIGEQVYKICDENFLQDNSSKFEKIFLKDGITIIEKKDFFCISEKDMAKILKQCCEDISVINVKKILADADALVRDSTKKYLKTIRFSGYNKIICVIAIKKDVLKVSGRV